MRIDTHVHIGGEKVGFSMTEEMVLAAMEKYRIDYALVSNGDAVEVSHEQKLMPSELQISQEDALRRVLAFAKKHPEKIGVAVWVKPLTEQVTTELEQLISDNLNFTHAIKLHPFHSHISPMDEKVTPYLELAQKYGLAVVSHLKFRLSWCIWDWARITKKLLSCLEKQKICMVTRHGFRCRRQ